MAIDWQQIITSLGGDALLLAAVAWLTKSLVSHRLTIEAEKFKSEVKAQADTEIERVKALLTRGYRIHERQLAILEKLYRHFVAAQNLIQRMTSAGRMQGEISPQEYAPKVAEEMKAAVEEYLDGKLFLPEALVQECEAFFQAVSEGQHDFAFANLPMLTPGQQAEFWKSAANVAFKTVPPVLKRIEDAARDVIHS